jgi:hypothetical protein
MKTVYPFLAASNFAGTALAAVILVPVILLAAYLLAAPRLLRFEVSPGGLTIRGDLFYGRTIPISDLDLDRARVVRLDAASEFTPVRRTNGTGLPGYQAGWFRLKDGGKALLFVGDKSSVTMIPVKQGYTLLISAGDAEKLLFHLKAARS